ncbi:hypothetical protein PPSIR1_35917 [Plesiocystis pacifica SIR-1]|uniref:Uncharacterized protein n=1 Tax=Plesiocystis pacifica SIR-1 TaxID=391625 RepID=A6G1W2_9BACT|nr:hypothetical protein [Plesiocystis pacifica]EDM80152.1 hypothetical protein PPSIR1_35917 [Plesiocystis pacifica SIR-1]
MLSLLPSPPRSHRDAQARRLARRQAGVLGLGLALLALGLAPLGLDQGRDRDQPTLGHASASPSTSTRSAPHPSAPTRPRSLGPTPRPSSSPPAPQPSASPSPEARAWRELGRARRTLDERVLELDEDLRALAADSEAFEGPGVEEALEAIEDELEVAAAQLGQVRELEDGEAADGATAAEIRALVAWIEDDSEARP